MHFHTQQAVRALILLGFSVMLYMMHFTGEIHLFINPKYLLLSQAAAFLFLVLFFIQITRVWTITNKDAHDSCNHEDACCSHDHSHHHDHGDTPFSIKKLVSYSIILLPLLTGFLLPAKVLDASIADKKGAMLSIVGSSKNGDKNSDGKQTNQVTGSNDQKDYVPTEDTKVITGDENERSEEEYEKLMNQLKSGSTIKFDDSIYSSYYEEISSNIDKYQGKTVSLNGFVYKEEGFSENQLVVSRFLVTHCVADASIIGFLSEFPEAASIEKDTWIKIEGVIETGSYIDTPIPLIRVSKWEVTEQPEVPYLYPITIRRN